MAFMRGYKCKLLFRCINTKEGPLAYISREDDINGTKDEISL